MDWKSWIKQPTTIIGIGALVGTAAGAVTHALTGSIDAAGAAGLVAAGAVHLVMPDNTGEPDAINKLVCDAVNAAVAKNLAGALPTLLQDGLAVVQAEQQPATKAAASTT